MLENDFKAISLIAGIKVVEKRTNSTLYETLEGYDRLTFVFRSEEPIESFHTICRTMFGSFDMTEMGLSEDEFVVTIGSLSQELIDAIKHYGEIYK